MANTMSKEITSHTSDSKVKMDNVSTCRIFSQCLQYILIYTVFAHPDLYYCISPYYVTYKAETLLVHSSVPATNKEIIKRSLINVCTLMVL